MLRRWLYSVADDFFTKQLPHNVTWGLTVLYALDAPGDFSDTAVQVRPKRRFENRFESWLGASCACSNTSGTKCRQRDLPVFNQGLPASHRCPLLRQGALVNDMRYLASVVTQCFTAFGELLALHKRFAELTGGITRQSFLWHAG